MKFLDWYVKIGAVSALIGASMEMFMIKTGFCIGISIKYEKIDVAVRIERALSLPFFYDKVTVLESEKLAWENSPEAQAIREALNPWRNRNAAAEAGKDT